MIEGLLLLVVVLAVGYPLLQNYREKALEKRLEKLHDPAEVSAEVDRMIQQSRQETDMINKTRGRGLF